MTVAFKLAWFLVVLQRAYDELIRHSQQQARELAYWQMLACTDPLTGLANRRHFEQRLGAELQHRGQRRRDGRPLAVALVDIDHFKHINDHLGGHPQGDLVLKRVADALRGAIRSSDLASRHGGEEFAIYWTEVGTSAVLLAERLREAVAALPFDWGQVTVSVGVALFPQHGLTVAELLDAADRALYQAKQCRNCVVLAAQAQPLLPAPDDLLAADGTLAEGTEMAGRAFQ